MNLELHDKVVLVTGGARGIGDGAEDSMAGGITERLGLALHVPIPIGHIAPTPGRTLTHTRPHF